MSWLDDFLSFVLSIGGARVDRIGGPTGKNLNLSPAFSATVNPATGNVDVDLAGTVPASTFASLTVTGSITQGTGGVDYSTTGKASTSGYETKTLMTAPLGAGSGCALRLRVLATDGTGPTANGSLTSSSTDLAVNTNSGSLATLGTVTTSGSFPLAVTTSSAWAAGTLTVSVTGPHATINGTSNAGGGTGKVRVQVSTGTPMTSWVGTMSVDISGIVGTTEANGTGLAATYVDSTHFDLLAITYVNAWVSGGLVVEHTPRTVYWGGSMALEGIVP